MIIAPPQCGYRCCRLQKYVLQTPWNINDEYLVLLTQKFYLAKSVRELFRPWWLSHPFFDPGNKKNEFLESSTSKSADCLKIIFSICFQKPWNQFLSFSCYNLFHCSWTQAPKHFKHLWKMFWDAIQKWESSKMQNFATCRAREHTVRHTSPSLRTRVSEGKFGL